MLTYADTSVLFGLVHPSDAFFQPVNRRVERAQPVFWYPPWLRFELRREIHASRIDEDGEVAWRALLAAETHRFRAGREDWLRVLQAALDLSTKHGRRTRCGALDVLHVASALEFGAAEFWTCDGLQAGLARAAGLKVVLLTC